MAGLVAAARARELGADVRCWRRAIRAGGSMLLSSGVVWRYREFDEYRGSVPAGTNPFSGSSGSASTMRSAGSSGSCPGRRTRRTR